MSNLSNLYISQSYYGVVNLVDSTQPFTSQSQTVIQFQDGVGESLGMSVTDVKDFIFDNNVVVSESLEVLGVISGSSARFSGDLFVSGNVHAAQVITTIESSSVIYSSGSNIIGDEVTDVQTIVGQTSISGSLTVIGPHSHTGDVSITGSLFVSNEISSSTISGLGNATIYSQSVDNSLNSLSQSVDNTITNLSSSIDSTITTLSQSVDSRLDFLEGPFSTSVDDRLDQLEGPFSTSVDSRLDYLEGEFSISLDNRLDNLELFTASQETINSGYNSFTQSYFVDSASFDTRIDALEDFSSSLVTNFVTETDFRVYTSSIDDKFTSLASYTGSVNSTIASLNAYTSSQNTKNSNLASYTGSNDTKWNTLGAYTSSNDTKWTTIGSYTSSNDDKWNTLGLLSGSFATTGSNIFDGSQVITGSVNGNVVDITISSSTASIDCSQGNFFRLTLPSGNTHMRAVNIKQGQTLNLKVTTQLGNTVTFDDSISFAQYLDYIPTNSGSVDILSFISFDSDTLYASSLNTL